MTETTLMSSSLKTAVSASTASYISYWPIRLLFALEATSSALILPRIPDIKHALALSDAELGVALVGIPVGTLIGLIVAPVIVRKVGLKAGAMGAVVALAWAFALPGLTVSRLGLFGAFFVCGIAISHSEIALNGLAGRLEAATGRRIMSQCHGFWSLGMIAGTILGGTLAAWDVLLTRQSLIAAIVLTAGVLSLSRKLPRPTERITSGPSGHRPSLPSRRLLALCFLPVGIMVIEGIFMDWSAVHLRLTLGADPFGASLGFSAFAAAMAITRLPGDALAARFGEKVMVVISCLAAGGGTLVFALGPTLAVACAGAAVSGAGAAIVYPIALSAAARLPGNPARNIAAVSFTSFAVLLGSPAAFGFVAGSFGYATAISLCAITALPGMFLTAGLAGPGGRNYGLGDTAQ
ncbi:MAG: hypothetical protein LJE67_07375 [Salaquimonas sp.]|nr:hypothetical protein [Salaquimonas sp.]